MTLKVAVDFDGTIAEFLFPEIGPVVPGAVFWCQRFVELGARLILWTCRADGQNQPAGDVLTKAADFCKSIGIELEAVNENIDPIFFPPPRKVHADVYIDDAAFGCPLIPATVSGRPMVDWSIVGPAVEKMILRELRLAA